MRLPAGRQASLHVFWIKNPEKISRGYIEAIYFAKPL
jgi:hypothetical protein